MANLTSDAHMSDQDHENQVFRPYEKLQTIEPPTSSGHHDAAPAPKPDVWASPSVLGLFGFALTTMCIGLSVTGNLGIDGVPGLAMAAAFGGTGQFIGGLIALRKGEIFSGTVFCCYGCFWWSVFIMDVVLAKFFELPPKANDMLIFWWMWTLVTITFLISSWKHGLGICATFIILIIAFFMLNIKQHLAIHDINNEDWNRATGWIIFLCGLCAWATGTAIMTNNQYGRVIIPLSH